MARAMRIAIIDTSTTRAAIISDGLREAGLDDLVVIDPAGPLVAQIEAAQPEVVLVNLENPGRDLLEDFFAMSRAPARPIAIDRKSVVWGKRGAVRVDLGGR